MIDARATVASHAALDEVPAKLAEAVRAAALDAADEAGRTLSPAALDAWLTGAATLAGLGRGEGPPLAWLAAMPAVARECGEDVLDDCLGAAMKMASMTSGEVIALTFRSLPDAARLLGDAELVRGYLAFLHRFAATAARGLRPMLENMPELLAKLTLSGLRRWADFGAQAYRRDFDSLVAYFSLDSADSRAVLQRERRGTLLVHVQRKLGLYLRALWGVDFFLRPAGSDHLDERPYVADHTLHLPDAVDDLGDVHGLELYRAAAAHMAAHLRHSVAPVGAEELSPAQMFFVGLFEDARVERAAAAAFPGIGRLWRRLLALPGTREPPADATARASLELLRRIALHLADADTPVDDAEACAIVRRWHAEVDARPLDGRLSWQRGVELFNLLAARRAVPSLRLLERLDIPYRDDNRVVWASDGFADEAGEAALPARERQVRRTVNLMELVNEVDNELAGDDAEEIWTCADELHPYEDDLTSTPSFNESFGRERVAEPVLHAEWDYQVQLMRPDWVTVRERRAPFGDPAAIDAILDEHKSIVGRIRRIVDLLSPAGVQRMRNLEDGDEIDLNAAIDAMVAIRAGEQPSSRITMRNVLRTRDLAVVILLDLSESTNETLRGSDRTVLALTREAAALVATAIDGIGDAFAVHGFASDGRHDVQYRRFKDFGERWGEESRARLAGMTGGLSTRMGAALRHAQRQLSRQRERRRLILLVTDGEPADIDERDPRYLRDDARKAVEELHAAGTHTYCLTLDASADEYVERIFGASGYTVVDDVERLPERLPTLFASLTA